MKVIVCPPTLVLGGSQINAIDLAAAVQELGHEALILGTPGPLEDMIARRGLRFVPLHLPHRPRPSMQAIRTMRRLVREERADVVHAWETSPALEAYFGAFAAAGVPLVTTVMSWSVPRLFPRSIPMTVGTTVIQEQTRRSRGGVVYLIEPPVNTDEDDPSKIHGSPFLTEHGLDDGRLNVVVVSRLEFEYKLEGIRRAIRALSLLTGRNLRLVIVGGGPAFDTLRREAEAANSELGAGSVVLTGPILDPRPAYAGADIVLGQGGSTLRGMAFGKPTIVLGEQGFSEIIEPATIDRFLRGGFYALGDGDLSPGRLAGQLDRLAGDEALRGELGAFSRKLVHDRYGLRPAAASLIDIYQRATESARFRFSLLPEVARTAAWVSAIKLKQRLQARQRAA